MLHDGVDETELVLKPERLDRHYNTNGRRGGVHMLQTINLNCCMGRDESAGFYVRHSGLVGTDIDLSFMRSRSEFRAEPKARTDPPRRNRRWTRGIGGQFRRSHEGARQDFPASFTTRRRREYRALLARGVEFTQNQAGTGSTTADLRRSKRIVQLAPIPQEGSNERRDFGVTSQRHARLRAPLLWADAPRRCWDSVPGYGGSLSVCRS